MKISLKGSDFGRIGSYHIRLLKETLSRKLANKVTREIIRDSKQQFVPIIDVRKDGFSVRIPTTPDDPDGAKALEVEKATKAFNKAYKSLSQKTFIDETLKEGD